MLHQLTLKNFKSWAAIEGMRIAPITGLFGTNSSGKSSVLQSLLLLKQTLESADRSLPLHLGSERDYVELGSFQDVIHKHVTDAHLEFAFKWDLRRTLKIEDPTNPTQPPLFQGNTLDFSTEIALSQDKIRVQNLCYTLGGQSFALSRQDSGNQYDISPTSRDSNFRFIRTLGRVWDLPQPFKFHGFPDQAITYFQNSGFLPDLQRQVEELFSSIYYLGPLREPPKRRYVWSGGEPEDMGRRGERTVDAILAARGRNAYISPGHKKRKKTLEERIAWWLKELGLIHSFSVASIGNGSGLFEVKVKKGPHSPEVLVTDVGFGVSQILPVLVLCYYVPEGSTILLEQPEIHLHPSVQMGLADVFIDVMKNRNIQIILESHSEHLLTRLQRRLAEEELDTENVALYFCSTGPSGSVLESLTLDLFGNIVNWPTDFFGDRFGETAAFREAGLKRKISTEGK